MYYSGVCFPALHYTARAQLLDALLFFPLACLLCRYTALTLACPFVTTPCNASKSTVTNSLNSDQNKWQRWQERRAWKSSPAQH